LGPTTLQGAHLRLEPLGQEHAQPLFVAARSPEIWTWLPAMPTTPAAMKDWIGEAVEAAEQGREYAFAVVWRGDARVLGSTRYMDVQPRVPAVEVGWTWYAPDTWGTVVNPEAKMLLLTHAFGEWGARRVALKTDALNLHSRAAILKLGARFEGILRNQRLRSDGSAGDTAMFSITDSEWPEVKAALGRRIAAEHA
jgi:RimJ/RimL family protein N-acetyltransferase